MPKRKFMRMCSDPIRPAGIGGGPPFPMGTAPGGLGAAPPPLAMAMGGAPLLWQIGQVLRVRFLDGEPSVRAKVESLAHTWEQHANIHFDFCDDPQAEIRVSFTHDAGSWSQVGKDALAVAGNEPTMNLGWLRPNTPQDWYDCTVQHEFGHALGCIHEHQNPAAGISWDKPAVYRYYARSGWSQEMVDINLFHKYELDQSQYSQFDPQSIMIYPIPRQLTLDGFEVNWNGTLSAMDKAFIGKIYPFQKQAVVDLVPGAQPHQATIREHGEEDLYAFQVPSPGSYTIATGGRTDVVMGLFGPDDRLVRVAFDNDSGQDRNAQITQALQPGKYFISVRHFRPRGTGKYTLAVARAP